MFHLTSRMCILGQLLKQKGVPIGWVNGFLSRDSSFPQMIRGSREKGDSRCNSERVTDSHSLVFIEAQAGSSAQVPEAWEEKDSCFVLSHQFETLFSSWTYVFISLADWSI